MPIPSFKTKCYQTLVSKPFKYTEAKDYPVCFFSSILKKLFDTLEWSFINQTLRHFAHAPSLLNWVGLFYCNIESCILKNGWASNFFDLSRGVRKCCPLQSPYLFIQSVGILAEAICNERERKGIKTQNTEVKVSQFADDKTLILDGTVQSVKASLLLIEAFGNISDLKLNNEKTEALWIGYKRNFNLKLCPEKNKWQEEKVKALGEWLSTDHQLTISFNYDEKLAKIKTILSCWT